MYLLRILFLIGLTLSLQPLLATQQQLLTFPKVSYAPIVKKAAPAVVSISTLQRINNSSPLFGNDPFFNFFFGDNLLEKPEHQRLSHSLGSGVIVDPTGIVVTCAHVIKNAHKIVIHLSDNRKFEGEVILKDMQNDLAVIRLKGVNKESSLPFIHLEESEIEVGDLVLVIGNPFGVGQTVTNGIISAIARNVRGRMLIQTDAPINPGNSGGSLVSMNGNLVGIPNAILSKTGVNHGIGFAIPSVMIRNLLSSINTGGKIIRPWVGIEVQRLTNELASSLGLQIPQGALVNALHPSSPARAAGLTQGDIITSINGHQILNPEEFIYRIQSVPLGQEIIFNIIRDQQKLNIGFYPIDPPAFPPPQKQRLTAASTLLNGMEVANLSPALVAQYQLPIGTPEQGVIITDPGKNPLSSRLNLNKGDIIEEMNGTPLRSVDNLLSVLSFLHGRINSIKIRQGDRRIEVKQQ